MSRTLRTPDIRVSLEEDEALREAYPRWSAMARAVLLYVAGREDLLDAADKAYAREAVKRSKRK